MGDSWGSKNVTGTCRYSSFAVQTMPLTLISFIVPLIQSFSSHLSSKVLSFLFPWNADASNSWQHCVSMRERCDFTFKTEEREGTLADPVLKSMLMHLNQFATIRLIFYLFLYYGNISNFNR